MADPDLHSRLWVNVAGQPLCLEGEREILEPLSAVYADFRCDPCEAGAIVLRVPRASLEPDRFEVVDTPKLVREGDRVDVRGRFEGVLWPGARRGELFSAASLSEVDAFIRLALSLALTDDGALLLHGAAVARDGAAVALVGASGAGKSTAAAALRGACDELVVLRLDGDGVQLHATPYWRGRRWSAPLSAVLCLERGGASIRRLRGAEAVRALLRHVVRYLAEPRLERALFSAAAEVARRAPVEEARCPEGAAFVPFLKRRLAVEERA
jgi:hypothetical protein